MKALVQRVHKASVNTDGETVARIGRGLLVFLGVGDGDDETDLEYLSGKVARMRIFADEAGKMNLSVGQVGGQILVVSQFTLYGDMKRGNRPSFTKAAEPACADRLYEQFCERLRRQGIGVETGTFAAHMDVELVNDGPVTLMLESPAKEKKT